MSVKDYCRAIVIDIKEAKYVSPPIEAADMFI